MKTGDQHITEERKEQKEVHGYDVTRDTELYKNGELLDAAYAYMIAGVEKEGDAVAATYWPWSPKSFKPKDRVKNLAKAGAFIAAEIDRLQALESKEN